MKQFHAVPGDSWVSNGYNEWCFMPRTWIIFRIWPHCDLKWDSITSQATSSPSVWTVVPSNANWCAWRPHVFSLAEPFWSDFIQLQASKSAHHIHRRVTSVSYVPTSESNSIYVALKPWIPCPFTGTVSEMSRPEQWTNGRRCLRQLHSENSFASSCKIERNPAPIPSGHISTGIPK